MFLIRDSVDLKPLFSNARELSVERNEVLHRPDEKCVSLGYVLSGRLVMKKYLSNGKGLYLTKFNPGDMYGELLVLSGENYRGWLTAEEPAIVLELSRHALDELLADPAFKQLYFHEISERVSRMTERIEILSYTKVSDRLILYFLNHFEKESSLNINISTLADELNCSREALSRAVSELGKEKALIKEGNKITLLDLLLLEKQLSFF